MTMLPKFQSLGLLGSAAAAHTCSDFTRGLLRSQSLGRRGSGDSYSRGPILLEGAWGAYSQQRHTMQGYKQSHKLQQTPRTTSVCRHSPAPCTHSCGYARCMRGSFYSRGPVLLEGAWLGTYRRHAHGGHRWGRQVCNMPRYVVCCGSRYQAYSKCATL